MRWLRWSVGTLIVALLIYLGVRAFQPPVPLRKVQMLKEGMDDSKVREILGEPTLIYPSRNYTVKGTNYSTGGQWTYQRFLTFGYVNVLFNTNGTVEYGHYEEF